MILEFRRVGEATSQIPGGDNYFHLQYASEELANRALDKNHKEMIGSRGTPFMIGVKLYTPQEAAVDQEGTHPSAQLLHGQQMRLPSELDANRLYLLRSNDDIDMQPNVSIWHKLGAFVFGA